MSRLNRLAILVILLLTSCGHFAAEKSKPLTAVSPPALMKIADNVWVHKSYEHVEPWGNILSQGLVVRTDTGLVLVDSAWNDADTEKLLDLIKIELGGMPVAAIFTHAHNDKMGGVGAIRRAGIKTFAHPLSNIEAPKNGLTPAEFDLTFSEPRGRETVPGQPASAGLSYFYPGAGHAADNIIVYDAKSKTLFAGCFIRPGTASGLGNTADGDVTNWAGAVRAVATEYPDAEFIIPSHGAPGGRALLQHTIDLVNAAQENQ